MNIAITGAAGFVGSHLTRAFLAGGHRVLALDLPPRRFLPLSRLKDINCPAGFFYQSVDVGSPSVLLNSALEWFQPDAIYHLAGIADPAIYVAEPQTVIDLNIDSIRNVIRCAQQLKKTPRIVFSSTSEVYGKNATVPFREDADCVFGDTRKTRWCYAQSKAVAEMLLRASGLPHTIFRFFNFVGPDIDSVGSGRVVTKMVGDAMDHGEIRVVGDGSQTRCFTLIDDALLALMAPALNGRGLNMTLNLGSDLEVSMLWLARAIQGELEKMGHGLVRISAVDPSTLGEGYEDIQRRVPDLTAATRELGWRPSVRVDEFLPGLVRAMGDARVGT